MSKHLALYLTFNRCSVNIAFLCSYRKQELTLGKKKKLRYSPLALEAYIVEKLFFNAQANRRLAFVTKSLVV